MALPEFDYIAAKSYEEASKLMVSMGSECVVMSGGTDVILQIPKFVSRGMKTVIDLKSVPEQTRLEFVEGEGLYVGANTKLFDIQSSPVVLDKMPAVAQAAHYVGSNQVRRKGTKAEPSPDLSSGMNISVTSSPLLLSAAIFLKPGQKSSIATSRMPFSAL